MHFLSDNSGIENLLRQQRRTRLMPESRKLQIKERIMNSVQCKEHAEDFAYTPLVAVLKNVIPQATPDPSFVAMLREKIAIVTHIDTRMRERLGRVRRPLIPSYRTPIASLLAQLVNGTLPRRLTASGILGVFVVMMVGNLFLSPEISYAKYETFIEDASGQVSVQRRGSTLNAYKGFVLEENDVITTSESSKASIRFLDQSIGRLDQNTALAIVSQEVDALNKSETVVEVALTEGRLWTRVVNLINDDSRFEVKTPSVTAVAKRRAAFDVKVSPEGAAQITAIHNNVDVRVASPVKVIETTLVKGFTAQVDAEISTKPVVTETLQSKAVTEESAKEAEWVSENLGKDEVYIAQVKEDSKQALRDQAGLVPGNPLYALKQLSDGANVVLSISDVSKYQKILSIAEGKLAEALVLSEKGDMQSARASLDEFLNDVKTVSDWINATEASNPKEVASVKMALSTLLAQSHKHFSLVSPIEELYEAKEAVTKAEVLAAPDAVAQTEEKLNNAAEKLLAAHELVEQGNATAATQQIDEYTTAIQEVVGTVKQLEPAKKEKAVEVLLDAKKEDMKTLEAITEVGAAAPATQAQVTQAKNEALTQIGEAVLDAQVGRTSPEVLQKIEAIKQLDVNGKSIVYEVKVTPGKLFIKTGTATILLPALPKEVLTTNAGTDTPANAVGSVTNPNAPTDTGDGATADTPEVRNSAPEGTTKTSTMPPKSDLEKPTIDRGSLKILP